MVKLQLENTVTTEESKPRIWIVALMIKLSGFFLRNSGADAAG